MKYKSLIFLILLLLCFVKPTEAISLKQYEEYQNDPELTEMIGLYIDGVEEGLFWGNTELVSEGRRQLYCQPENMILEHANCIRILEAEIEVRSKTLTKQQLEDVPIELLLLEGLKRTFPCPEDK